LDRRASADGRIEIGPRSNRARKRCGNAIEDGWKGIPKVFILACRLDVIYAWIVWRSLRPLQMVLVTALPSVIP
jgi:hypothetical protein